MVKEASTGKIWVNKSWVAMCFMIDCLLSNVTFWKSSLQGEEQRGTINESSAAWPFETLYYFQLLSFASYRISG